MRRAICRFFAETLEQRVLLTTVTSVNPLTNTHAAAVATNVAVTFDQNVNGATANPQTLAVYSSQGGRLVGSAATVSTNGSTVILNPTPNFFPGELVEASVTSRIQSISGEPATPHVWQFRTAVRSGSGVFTDSGQLLGLRFSVDVALGDLDGDGDLDAFVANYNQGNGVWLNDGGVFSDSQQSLGDHTSVGVALGDLDGDGDLDAFVSNGPYPQANRVWLNDGRAFFRDSGQSLGNSQSIGVSLGDVDGDGDLDAFVGNLGENRLFLNDGGLFSDSGQSLGNNPSIDVALGDLDSDGDLDAFVVNGGGQANRVWLNNGRIFSNSGQQLGNHTSNDVALGDLDGDGDLDAFVANDSGEGNRVWLNGGGQFSDSGQSLGNHSSTSIELGDLDGDGDLDAFVANGPFGSPQDNRVWLNDGAGLFSDSGQTVGSHTSRGVSLGDLDGDGDLDAFVANFAGPNRVWLDPQVNTSSHLAIAATDSTKPEGSAGSTTFSFTVTRSGNLDTATSVQYAVTGSSANPADAADFGGAFPSGVVNFAASETERVITINVSGDTTVEADEEFTVTLSNPTPVATDITTAAAIGVIQNDDEPPPTVTLRVDNATIPEASGVATFTATLSAASTLLVTVDLEISGTAAASDFTASGTQILIAAGATTGSVSVTAVQDALDEPDETVVVDIVTITNGLEDGTQQATTTILDDDDPLGLVVTSLTATDSGFVAQFSGELEPNVLNVFDTESAVLGAADIFLRGTTSGAVTGSSVVDVERRKLTFIKSGGPLRADTYTVTLRSAVDGFRNLGGLLLDGDGNGTEGDDFIGTFAIEPAGNAVIVSLPDFVRGPGQDVNLPAERTTGIPLSISEGASVRNAEIRLDYNPSLLTITAATVAPAMPAGAAVALDTSTTGTAVLTFTSPVDLPTGSNVFVNLQASVPTADSTANYRRQQVLDLHSVAVRDANRNPLRVLADDAVHLATYFGDVSGNGRINASDAAQVARIAAVLDAGFAATPLTDPTVVGDISGNVRINAADASLVAQFAARIDVPTIPPIPGGVVVAGLDVADLRAGLSEHGGMPSQMIEMAARPGANKITGFGDGAIASSASDPSPAVNIVMASLDESNFDEDDHRSLIPALEEAIAELLSATRLTEHVSDQ